MAKKGDPLHRSFRPASYRLEVYGGGCRLKVAGLKLPPPAKRISLHQKGIKVSAAEVASIDKKQWKRHEVVRINHLPTFEQVRLHTADVIYPGQVRLVLEYQLPEHKLKRLKESSGKPPRELMPSIDEQIPGDPAGFELIYLDGQK